MPYLYDIYRYVKANMKLSFLFLLIIFGPLVSKARRVKNTSYITSTGEKVLRFDVIVPVDRANAWQYFTTDEKLKQWIAPLVHIDLRTGGSIVTNYNPKGTLNDSTVIRLGIINYLENEMLTLKVKLNHTFPTSTCTEDQNLQEVIQLTEIDKTHTKVSSSMVGWGQGADWDTTYKFFEKGNECTAKEIAEIFYKGVK